MMNVIPLIVCGFFLVVGVVIVDDYGLSPDDYTQRAIAVSAVDYVMGIKDSYLQSWTRNYGVAFELSLLAFERILGLEDSRDVYLSRHLLTHLFFLAGGFFCSLLVYRLFNSRWLALFALLLFLLHPRMYAHSFFNSKDLPFLSMFMIDLLLIHRAFRKDTTGAFLLCGIGIGILSNIRIIGIMLFPAILAMRVCDLFHVSKQEERMHILITTTGFVLASVLTLYATWPYLWSDPVGHIMDAFTEMARYPYFDSELFQGGRVDPQDLPLHYVPVWFLITTPPVALLFGIIGTGSILLHGILRPGDILRNTPLRFGFLLIACFVLPISIVVFLGSTLYAGARQMFFLYAPFCLVAIFGLHQTIFLFRRRLLRTGVYVIAGAGVAMMLSAVIRIHPLQQVYFNFLVDRTTPEYLSSQYWMDHWGAGSLKILEYLLEQYPSSLIYIPQDGRYMGETRMILPETDRKRVFIGIGLDGPNFAPWDGVRGNTQELFVSSLIYTNKIYNLQVHGLDSRHFHSGRRGKFSPDGPLGGGLVSHHAGTGPLPARYGGLDRSSPGARLLPSDASDCGREQVVGRHDAEPCRGQHLIVFLSAVTFGDLARLSLGWECAVGHRLCLGRAPVDRRLDHRLGDAVYYHLIFRRCAALDYRYFR